MNFSKSSRVPRRTTLALLLSAMVAHAQAANAAAAPADAGEQISTLDQVQVVGQATTYAKISVSKEMLDRQFAMGSVNDVLNELPGVIVTEADAFGSSDWGTQISMRGFVSNRDTQQIGTTIDGLPNGGSAYGGGSKANRFIDPLDLETVEVSQGTADIASRSNEALGGTLNYLTSAPLDAQRVRAAAGIGDNDARKYYARYDSGLIGASKAWLSASHSSNDDWIDGSGHTTRDHLAGKFDSDLGAWKLSGYLSYDDADESEYSSVTPAQFARDPEHDLLTGRLTGIPYLDQNYRSGSRALRKNSFGYLRGAFDGGNGVKATLAGYAHRMRGRGDWIPPYLVDVTNDGGGAPESEYLGGHTVSGGSDLGKIYFVTPSGAAAARRPGCRGNGALPAEFDPACYPAGSLPVQSYRHSHYANERAGVTADAQWRTALGAIDNTARAGVWLEQYRRSVTRDWHRLLNVGTNIAFDHAPYWVQFKDRYDTDERMHYVEDVMRYGNFAWRMGVKQFFVDQTRDRRIGASAHVASDSHSDPLFSAGLTWTTPVKGLEAFAGYSQNFAAIPSGVLGETDPVALSRVKPETADNIELGLRISRWPLTGSVTVYDIRFDNRIVYVPANFVDGIDYLGETDGVYENFGGVHARGVEAALGYGWGNGWRVNGAYTFNKATYLGSGDAARDTALEITPGAQVIGQPRNTLVASADWQGQAWAFGLSGRYLGKRYLDASNTRSLDGATTFDAHLGLSLSQLSAQLQGMKLDLNVSNLTDKRYLQGVDGSDSAFIAAPRTVGLTLTLDL
ncbi:TonB-dependent receptor domain-containing protein [Xanthomonas theicola]|uniref:TonB-dependent receptor n=1 Tax=Xanthomonas theicola TaxID=56464 RepID=A0A2S6ZLQ3_9XANT|nr:TonB-dependent receptor [Xanthomonas theicola]PPT93212.1 TonB-dependent receptor [Xanthomonas theicola]QNH24852.1 TonB-dependent receptor [Xanthomonas theicola]